MTDGQWVFIGFGLVLIAAAVIVLVRSTKQRGARDQ